jgi:hypothetical protein
MYAVSELLTLGERAELRVGVHDALDEAEQVEGAARQPIHARPRH